MLSGTLTEINISTVGTPLVLLLVIYAAMRRKNSKKIVSEEEIDSRILAFKPEPLIDYSKIDTNSDRNLEIHQPDESNPECLNLAKVNYLNLINNEYLKKEAESCIRVYGVGSCGPRGFYGTIDIHLTLESRLAKFMETEEAVLYSYGFSTIASAIGAYCKKSDIIFGDEKLSFPAGQGILAAKSKVVLFKHNDMEDLEAKLKEYERKEKERKKLYRKFLIVEGIYGATGTICPLPKLMELREKYKLRIFIDESISFGVLGKTGRGVTEHFNIDRSDVDMIIGSLEGSVSSIGGFCVGASVIVDHQRLFGLGYCFSASLPPFLSQISICALDMFEKDVTLFQRLRDVSVLVDEKLKVLDYYLIISHPLSPLKVITTRELENRTENLKKIHAFCERQNVYVICSDQNISFNVNIALDESKVQKLVETLKQASCLCRN